MHCRNYFQALLSNIVNKLGDPSHKVGSKVIYSLTKLLQTHPNMREVVMEEVEKLLFRPNIGKRAQYYGICFLTQFCLTKDDAKLARKLILVYLSIFKACIKTVGCSFIVPYFNMLNYVINFRIMY